MQWQRSGNIKAGSYRTTNNLRPINICLLLNLMLDYYFYWFLFFLLMACTALCILADGPKKLYVLSMTDIPHKCVFIYIKTPAPVYISDHITYILKQILSFFHCEMWGKDELHIIFKNLNYHCILPIFYTRTRPTQNIYWLNKTQH